MLEGYFSFKDLDDIKFELQMLEGVNLDTLKQCLKILDKFDSQYSNNIEKLQLQILKQKYQKLRTADKIYKEIEKDLSSSGAKFLSKDSKNTIKELQNLLAGLGEFWIFDIINSLKMCKINLQKLKDVLYSQEKIINKHIISTCKQERKDLYKDYLQNESELHKVYSDLGSKFSLLCSKCTRLSS